ncbi:MAG: HAMP domain-containing histidine kinase, partial [Haliea sp.]
VFVSAAAKDLNYAFAGYESGAVDFLYKPLDVHAVRSKVSAFVEMFRQRQRQEILLAELRAAQSQLQRAVQMRDDFMSMVSHELRTPLNTLFLQAQLRRRIAAGASLSPEKMQSMVERDEQQIRNILRLIDDMLDVSRLRQGMLSIAPQPADMSVLVRRVVESHADQAAAAGSPIEVLAPQSVPGVWDEFRIEQVVANLLTNAVRYGGGKPVQVSAEARGAHAVVTVRDRGIGIAPQDQARIFEQFERAVGSQAVPGLGLGLFITHQIVKAHNGRIEVDSAPGEGSAFTVTLPLDTPTPAPT